MLTLYHTEYADYVRMREFLHELSLFQKPFNDVWFLGVKCLHCHWYTPLVPCYTLQQ